MAKLHIEAKNSGTFVINIPRDAMAHSHGCSGMFNYVVLHKNDIRAAGSLLAALETYLAKRIAWGHGHYANAHVTRIAIAMLKSEPVLTEEWLGMCSVL